jgi:hypothetical protein
VKVVAFATVAAAALNLTACAGPSQGSNSYPPYVATNAAAPTSSSNAATGTRQARLTSPTAKPTLDTMTGMSGSDLTTWLGAPQFRRQDGQAEIWQYRASACTLDVFLYNEGSDLRVRYVEPRNHAATANAPGDPAQARACASALIQSRAGGAGPG